MLMTWTATLQYQGDVPAHIQHQVNSQVTAFLRELYKDFVLVKKGATVVDLVEMGLRALEQMPDKKTETA